MPNLKMPFPAGELWTMTRGYDQATHKNYANPTTQDKNALDFALPGCNAYGRPVLAVADGVVEFAGLSGGYGNTVVLNHGDGYKSRSAHLSEISVQPNAFVSQGQEVGKMGNSGNVSGSGCASYPGTHLHFVMYFNGQAFKPEPMSGYTNIGTVNGALFLSDNYRSNEVNVDSYCKGMSPSYLVERFRSSSGNLVVNACPSDGRVYFYKSISYGSCNLGYVDLYANTDGTGGYQLCTGSASGIPEEHYGSDPVVGGDGGGSNPPPSTSLPNLQIQEITVHTYPEGSGSELIEGITPMDMGTTYQTNVWPVSKEENCQNGNTTGNQDFTVKTDTFFKIALSEDEGTWQLLKRSETHCKYLVEDDSKKEMITFTLPVGSEGKRLYLKAKVDATDGIAETDENENWSDVEWYPIRGACNLVIVSARLTAGRISLTQGENYGFAATLLNIGSNACPSDTRLSYFYKKPGDTDFRYADGDDTPAFKLLPNQPNEEWMTTDTLVADMVGTHEAKVCADTNNANRETTKEDNCYTFFYDVLLPPPSSMVVTDPPAGATWRCSTSSAYQYIRWNGVTYAQSPTVELWYSLDDGSSWRLIDSAVSNDGKYRWYMCKYPIGKDSAYGRVKVVARYNGQTFSALSGRFYVDYARGCK